MLQYIFFIVLAIAAWIDYKKRKVPHWVLPVLFGLCIPWNGWNLDAVAGAVLAALVGIVMWKAKMWGGGDAKLVIAFGYYWGSTVFIAFLGLTALIVTLAKLALKRDTIPVVPVFLASHTLTYLLVLVVVLLA